ncbi:MAG: VOC family protein, partial [Pseudomonadota bacterium]
DEQYLEIIAPDPNQALVGNLGEELSSSGDGGRIHTWAAATDDLDHVAQLASEFGYRHRRIAMSRVRPDGAQLAWELLFIDAHPFGHCMPFFIDWQQSPHPSYDSPGGCRLESFTVSIDKLIETFRDFAVALQLEISIKMGPAAMMASINGSNGKVSLR